MNFVGFAGELLRKGIMIGVISLEGARVEKMLVRNLIVARHAVDYSFHVGSCASFLVECVLGEWKNKAFLGVYVGVAVMSEHLHLL